MTMFGNCEAQAMLPRRKMLFDGEIEFVRGLNSRCVFCDYAATPMIDLSQSSNDRFGAKRPRSHCAICQVAIATLS